MKRLAHRGYSDLFPENTMSAFEKAVNSSFEGIETDVQMTIDGELLLLHDDKINRTSDGKGILRNMTFNEARQYNYNNKMDITEQIHTLDPLLTLIDHTDKLFNIEITKRCDYEASYDRSYLFFFYKSRKIIKYAYFNA